MRLMLTHPFAYVSVDVPIFITVLILFHYLSVAIFDFILIKYNTKKSRLQEYYMKSFKKILKVFDFIDKNRRS